MERWLGPGLAALALGLGAWNTWTLWRLEQQLGERVVDSPRAASAPHRGERTADVRRPRDREAGASRSEPAPPDGDPMLERQIEHAVESREQEREVERIERFRESIDAELETFAREHALDDRTVDAVRAELLQRMIAFQTIRQETHDGSLSWLDARKDLQDLRAASDDRLRQLLGDDAFDQLDTRIWGDQAHRPWR